MHAQEGAQHERPHRMPEHHVRHVPEAPVKHGAHLLDVGDEVLGPGVWLQHAPGLGERRPSRVPSGRGRDDVPERGKMAGELVIASDVLGHAVDELDDGPGGCRTLVWQPEVALDRGRAVGRG